MSSDSSVDISAVPEPTQPAAVAPIEPSTELEDPIVTFARKRRQQLAAYVSKNLLNPPPLPPLVVDDGRDPLAKAIQERIMSSLVPKIDAYVKRIRANQQQYTMAEISKFISAVLQEPI